MNYFIDDEVAPFFQLPIDYLDLSQAFKSDVPSYPSVEDAYVSAVSG